MLIPLSRPHSAHQPHQRSDDQPIFRRLSATMFSRIRHTPSGVRRGGLKNRAASLAARSRRVSPNLRRSRPEHRDGQVDVHRCVSRVLVPTPEPQCRVPVDGGTDRCPWAGAPSVRSALHGHRDGAACTPFVGGCISSLMGSRGRFSPVELRICRKHVGRLVRLLPNGTEIAPSRATSTDR